MAVSGSFDFSQTRSELIKDAFVEAGVLRQDETPESQESEYAARTLNRMLKSFTTDGLHLFSIREATLFLQLNQVEYNLGPSGDNCTESYVATQMRVAAASSATTMEVDSTTGMTASDNIGVEVDDGTMHWTTIASITDSDTLELTTGLDDTAAVDNVVYTYTTKIQRPLNIIHGRLHYYTSDYDAQMYHIGLNNYRDLSQKDTNSPPSEYAFSKQLTNSVIKLYGESTNTKDRVVLALQFPFDDMDAAANTLSFPQEWLEAIHLGLSYRLARSYRSKDPKTATLKMDSEQAKYQVIGFDEERAHLDLQPTLRQ